MLEKTCFYIDGAWINPSSQQQIEVVNPSSGKAFASITLGNRDDLDKVVSAAHVAAEDWCATTVLQRQNYLNRLLEIYKSRASEMAALISQEMGAPIGLAQTVQVGSGIGHLKQAIITLERFEFERTIPNRDSMDHIFLEPVGVVGLITPWNWPMNQIMLKVANIIFADADEKAVGRGVRQCFLNSGQSCNAPTRMLVEESIYEGALEQARAMAEKTEVGHADVEGRHIGPVASQIQYDKIQQMIEAGVSEGARLLCGGAGKPDGLEAGYFVKPTIFADVIPEMTIFKEEIFGPVLCITPFSSEAEAVDLANDTAYGLTNCIQTQDAEKARRVAAKLKSGMVEINGQLLSPAAPFGGRGLSGNGVEGGVWGLEEFLQPKAVSGIQTD